MRVCVCVCVCEKEREREKDCKRFALALRARLFDLNLVVFGDLISAATFLLIFSQSVKLSNKLFLGNQPRKFCSIFDC